MDPTYRSAAHPPRRCRSPVTGASQRRNGGPPRSSHSDPNPRGESPRRAPTQEAFHGPDSPLTAPGGGAPLSLSAPARAAGDRDDRARRHDSRRRRPCHRRWRLEGTHRVAGERAGNGGGRSPVPPLAWPRLRPRQGAGHSSPALARCRRTQEVVASSPTSSIACPAWAPPRRPGRRLGFRRLGSAEPVISPSVSVGRVGTLGTWRRPRIARSS